MSCELSLRLPPQLRALPWCPPRLLRLSPLRLRLAMAPIASKYTAMGKRIAVSQALPTATQLLPASAQNATQLNRKLLPKSEGPTPSTLGAVSRSRQSNRPSRDDQRDMPLAARERHRASGKSPSSIRKTTPDEALNVFDYIVADEV